jgi:hypothetical protein
MDNFAIAAPEPSTRAMMLMGFVGLPGIGLSGRPLRSPPDRSATHVGEAAESHSCIRATSGRVRFSLS